MSSSKPSNRSAHGCVPSESRRSSTRFAIVRIHRRRRAGQEASGEKLIIFLIAAEQRFHFARDAAGRGQFAIIFALIRAPLRVPWARALFQGVLLPV